MNRAAALICCIAALAGCEGSGEAPPQPAGTERVVSLSPAITLLLSDLSLDDRLVGRSAFCRGVDALPVGGDLSGVDVETVVRLQPDLLIHQQTAAPPPAGLHEAAEMAGAQVLAVPVDNMDDLHQAIDSIVSAMDPDGADAILQQRRGDLHQVLYEAVAPKPTGHHRVMLLQPGPSMLLWGGQTWLGHIVQAAGAQVVMPDRAWVGVSAEDVVRLEPDVIFVLAEQEHAPLEAAASLPTPAQRDGRVYLLSHPRLMIPGLHALQVREQVDTLLQTPSAAAAG
ncbi:MAG: ABC transporter substrate-binding protein [Phycisphaerales bacterium]|nr:ABC transporter substrate-binding protein [Phycisphaerales bacterium]